MIRSKLTLALVFVLGLGAPTFAQDKPLAPTGEAPMGGAPAGEAPAADPAAPVAPPQVPATPDTPTVEGSPKDPGGWKGQQQPAGTTPQAGVPETAADPLAAGNTPPAKEVDPAEQAKNNRIIDNNYNAAMKTYEDVLNNEGEPVQGLDHRIKTNENLIADYKKKLAATNEQKRRLQVELFNRTFYLKQQRDKGAIPEDVYEKLMKQEEKKYQTKSANVTSDAQFLEKEIGDAEKRLTELRAERRVHVTAQNTTKAVKGGPGGKAKAPQKASEKLIGGLKGRLQKLNAFETKRLMDGYSVCEQCLAPHAPGGPHGGAPEGGEAPTDK
jgi:hypothetical protein